MNKVIVIGLDGATWKVLMPLIEMDELPNLANVINKGVYGDLESTFPPVTGPAWLSMATGKNPGKTGVYDFLTKSEEGFSNKVINSNDFRKNNAYWDLLNQYGYRTYLLNHPMLHPFYDINGVIVGGIGTPKNSRTAYPNYLEEKLNKITGGYWTRIDWHSPKYFNNKSKLIEDLYTLIEKQFRAVNYLIRQNWDFFLHVSSASDFLQHVMWEDWNDVGSKYHRDFINIWKKLDEGIGAILQNIYNTNFFIVSDHGFGPLKENFLLSKWLVEKNYLKKNYFHKTRKATVSFLNFIYKKIENLPLQKYLDINQFRSRSLAKILNLGTPLLPEVDISKSIVIPGYSSGAHGALHIKESVQNYNEFREKLIKELEELGKLYGIDIEVYKREELYWGEKSNRAPDLMFKINNHQCNLQASLLKGEIFSNNLPFKNKSGSHRKEGIFCAYGPDIKKGEKVNGAKIYDIAPTILHIFGLPVPDDMDGSILKEIFKEGSEPAQREVKYQVVNVEREKVKDRIRKLKESGKL